MTSSTRSEDRSAVSSSIFSAPRFRLGWILVAIGAIVSLGAVVMRWSYENSSSQMSAQLTVDYDDTRGLADVYGVTQLKLLQDLRERGVSSLGVYQQTLATYRNNARLATTTREEAERLYPNLPWQKIPDAYRLLLTTTRDNDGLLPRLFARIKEQSQPATPPIWINAGSGLGLLIPNSPQLVGDAPMGFDAQHLALAKAAGLGITARINNSLNLDIKPFKENPKSNRLDRVLDDVKNTGAKVVLFADDEVLGYESLIKNAAEGAKSRGLLFGTIEFGKQKGADVYSKLTEGDLVRVHSVGSDEASKAKIELLTDRYVRAVRERNIRVLYIRLVRQLKGEDKDGVTKTAMQQNLDFVGAIADELKRAPLGGALRPAYNLSTAQGFRNFPISTLSQSTGSELTAKVTSMVLRFFAGLATVGGVLLLLNLFFDLSKPAQRNWLLSGLFIVAALSLSAGIGAKLTALVAGCVFSVVGVLWGGLPQWWDDSFRRSEMQERPRIGEIFTRSLGILVKTTAITSIGGMVVINLLNGWKYMSKTDEFLGEKATLLFPLILVALAFAGEVFPHRVLEDGATAARNRGKALFARTLDTGFTVRIALTLFVLMIVGFVFIARSGNDSGMQISSFEWNMRAFLEQLLITRPRTKEFLIGVPAVLFVMWFTRRRQWTPAFLAVVAVTIGQADVVNTWCHIHTPIFYSLLRTVHAVWIGAILGAIMLWIWSKLEAKLFSTTDTYR